MKELLKKYTTDNKLTLESIISKLGQPILTFTPDGDYSSFNEFQQDDVPDEIAVFKLERIPAGVIVYGRWGNNWYPNGCDRFVISHLLKKV